MMNAFVRLPDLASRALGGAVIDANDDFLADRAALIMPAPAQPRAEFGYRGKVYDRWETRRRREPGSDHAIIGLPQQHRAGGRGVDHAGAALGDQRRHRQCLRHRRSTPLDTCQVGDPPRRRSSAVPGAWPGRGRPRLLQGTIDLAAREHGGSLVECSSMFFSSPANLLLPVPARSMGEGWETARRRGAATTGW
jgi:allantoicase